MIKLDVKDYCHTCKDFKVETIDERTEYYCQSFCSFGEGEIKHAGDLIIRCKNRATCDRIQEHLKEQLKKENK